MKRVRRRDYRPWGLLLAVLALGGGCDALFRPFLEPGPQSCSAGCAPDQTCNPTTNLCEGPGDLGLAMDASMPPPTGISQLSLLAGAIGGRGNANDSGAFARFNGPVGVVVDASGNVYVSEQGSHTIRRFAAGSSAVTLVAGSPEGPGFADGVGTAARFKNPQGLVLDDQNNLYVADSGNHRIRKIDLATNTVSTLAGNGTAGSTAGTGTAATFNAPSALAIRNGALLVVDSGSGRIRSVSPTSQMVTNLNDAPLNPPHNDGPLSSASFKNPRGITVDGNFAYVADSDNHVIRKLDLVGSMVSTLAGSVGMPGSANGTGPAANFQKPWGITADRVGNLFVIDSDGYTVRKIVISTASVSTPAGLYGSLGAADGPGSMARFYAPQGLSFANGYLYIADTENHTLRVLTLSNASVATLAGTPASPGVANGTMAMARFSSPGGIAADSGGRVAYIIDKTNCTIRQAELPTGKVTPLAGMPGGGTGSDGVGMAATFFAPHSAVLDGAGNLYVTDSNNHTIRRIVLATAQVTTIAGMAGMLGSSDGTGASARFSIPAGIAIDAQGTLYVADSNNHAIRRITTNNAVYQVTTLAGAAGMTGFADQPGSAARFSTPLGIAVAPDGDVLVSDNGNLVIRRINVATGAVSTLAGVPNQAGFVDGSSGIARFRSPQGLAVDKTGSLYVADAFNSVIRKVDLAGGNVSTVIGTPGVAGVKLGPLPGRLNSPVAVAVLPSGLLISDQVENAVLYAN